MSAFLSVKVLTSRPAERGGADGWGRETGPRRGDGQWAQEAWAWSGVSALCFILYAGAAVGSSYTG